ncbi:MAG: hypothetical protein Q9165_007793 [Trypethelium subeluteriae]
MLNFIFVAAGLVPITIIYVVYQRFFHPLAKIPGPFWASLSRLWMTKHSWDGDMHQALVSVHKKYGKLVRTGPNEVSIADLGAMRTIYGAGSRFRKSEWYSVVQGHRKFDIFAERNEKVHASQRKLVSRPYAMEVLKDLEPYVDTAIEVFMRKMDSLKGQSIDMGNWIALFAFDVIGEITFSKSFGFMEAGQDDGSFSAIHRALENGSWLAQIPSIFWIHDRLIPYIGNWCAINNRHVGVRNFSAKEVSSRKVRGSDRKDILSKLFTIHDEKPGDFDQNAVVSMATSNIFAGTDTTASSTRAIIYYLLKNPQYKERLVQEIDERRAQGKLSDPVSLAQADSMPYLQAVMYEALRCTPAVGYVLPRVVPPEGLEVGGHVIPEGSVVGMSAWVVHKDKEVYGEDAEAFRPDRWLEGDPGDKKRFFFSFGSGARLCIGKNISWLEMSKLIPTLFMHYDLELADPAKEWTEKSFFLMMQKGLEVIVRPRAT